MAHPVPSQAPLPASAKRFSLFFFPKKASRLSHRPERRKIFVSRVVPQPPNQPGQMGVMMEEHITTTSPSTEPMMLLRVLLHE